MLASDKHVLGSKQTYKKHNFRISSKNITYFKTQSVVDTVEFSLQALNHWLVKRFASHAMETDILYTFFVKINQYSKEPQWGI